MILERQSGFYVKQAVSDAKEDALEGHTQSLTCQCLLDGGSYTPPILGIVPSTLKPL